MIIQGCPKCGCNGVAEINIKCIQKRLEQALQEIKELKKEIKQNG